MRRTAVAFHFIVDNPFIAQPESAWIIISEITFDFQTMALLLAWEWFSPDRRGFTSGVVQSFHGLSVALLIGIQIMMIEYKNLAPIEQLKLQDSDIDIYPQKVAMKMILLYFVICGIQGIVAAAVLAFASRNEIQQMHELRHDKSERRIST